MTIVGIKRLVGYAHSCLADIEAWLFAGELVVFGQPSFGADGWNLLVGDLDQYWIFHFSSYKEAVASLHKTIRRKQRSAGVFGFKAIELNITQISEIKNLMMYRKIVRDRCERDFAAFVN